VTKHLHKSENNSGFTHPPCAKAIPQVIAAVMPPVRSDWSSRIWVEIEWILPTRQREDGGWALWFWNSNTIFNFN